MLSGLDLFLIAAAGILVVLFAVIVRSYSKGLGGSPRELYLVLSGKFIEYSAFAACMLSFVLFLSFDVGLSDVAAGSYVGLWMVLISALMVLVGAVCDVVGIKKTLLIGVIALLIGRIALVFTDDVWLVSLLGFVPLALGVAIAGPVLLVAVKKFTTEAGATLAFGLYITLMNLGFATGGWIFDFLRGIYGDYSIVAVLPVAGEVSVYQLIIGVGFAITICQLIVISMLRNNVEMTEQGVRFLVPPASQVRDAVGALRTAVGSVVRETGRLLFEVVRERRFWWFISALGITVFIRIASIQFLLTFPTYGIRFFGDGAQVGNLYGVLNPMVIVFLTPLFAILTVRLRSYTMLLVGSAISAASIWIATLPPEIFTPLVDTGFGELVFERWLSLPTNEWHPLYLSLVIFIGLFSIGEAIWAPRVMQFTAEIAPPGKEGSYIALSYLPFFLGQLIAGPLSGLLLANYMRENAAGTFPDHYMVWVWIGLIAALTPLAMLICRKLFRRVEEDRPLAHEDSNTY